MITGAVRLILVWQTHSKFVDFRVKHAGGRVSRFETVAQWIVHGVFPRDSPCGKVRLRWTFGMAPK